MKITLKRQPNPVIHTGRYRVRHWRQAEPFFVNHRGLLVHRVESVRTYYHGDGTKHTAVTYICANGTTAQGDFVARPPRGRLVCQACELAAKRKGKPSSDKLVGRHVHVGRIRAERVCCNENRN